MYWVITGIILKHILTAYLTNIVFSDVAREARLNIVNNKFFILKSAQITFCGIKI